MKIQHNYMFSLFKGLEILELTDRVTLHNALLMYNDYYNLLPSAF